jgi:hypothetical protein
MTQVELAGLADLSPSFVSMIENGQRPRAARHGRAHGRTALIIRLRCGFSRLHTGEVRACLVA